MKEKMSQYRKLDYKIDKMLYTRWSPRAMTGEKISQEELFTLFEAARWAPSSFNEQPWHFCYAIRETEAFNKYFSLLVDFNKSWCVNAAVLLIITSCNFFVKTQKYSPTHSYDTGAAWENLALEGSKKGLVVHGMSGFDFEKAKEIVNLPPNYSIEAMAAIGKRAEAHILSDDLLKKEFPSSRKKIEEFIHEGTF